MGHIIWYCVNDDGKVSRDEPPEPMRGILERADTNGDNAVNRQELLQLPNNPLVAAEVVHVMELAKTTLSNH